MFLFIPQLLIVLSLAGIILIVLRRTPELRFPVPVLVKNLEGFLQKWTALGFEKLWLFVLEVKEISKKTKPLGFLPKSLPKLHLPGRPRLNMSSFTGPKPGTAEFFIKQGEKSLAAGDHYNAEQNFIRSHKKRTPERAGFCLFGQAVPRAGQNQGSD